MFMRCVRTFVLPIAALFALPAQAELTTFPYFIQYSALKLEATGLYYERWNDAETNPLNVSFRRIYLVLRIGTTNEFVYVQYHELPSLPADPDFLKLLEQTRHAPNAQIKMQLYCKVPEASLPAGYINENGITYYARSVVRFDNQGADSYHRNCYMRYTAAGL
jgi:hypothetical protein